MLDATVVNIALPSIGRDLGADLAGLQWTVNAYTLTLAALILLGGSLGDRYGRRRVFVVGVVWFAVASLLCAVVPTVTMLVLARAFQGVGGALLAPASLAIIVSVFAEADRPRAIGAWSGLGGIVAAAGPFLGGYLVSTAGWRWIFLLNVPLAVVVVVLAWVRVPETSDPAACPGLDVTGAVLGALALAGVTYALIAAGERGPTAPVTAVGVGGLVAFVAFLGVERRSRNPMLPLGLFASRQFSAANAVTFLVYAALGGVFFFLVLDLQVVAGFSALAAGAALLPVTVLMLAGSAASGALAQRIGPRLPMTVGPAVSAAGVLLLLRVDAEAGYLTDVLPAMVVFGTGLVVTVTPLTTAVLAAVPSRFAGLASGVNNAVARTAGLLAVTVLPVIAGLSGAGYADPARFAQGFQVAVLACALLLGAGAVLAAALVRAEPVPVPARGAGAARSRSHCAVDATPLAPAHEPVGAKVGNISD
jgi:EmrB/QacA subfamily drug resistance transporter